MGESVSRENDPNVKKYPWDWQQILLLVVGIIMDIGIGFAFAERVGLIHFR